jgi:hypothetical protein
MEQVWMVLALHIFSKTEYVFVFIYMVIGTVTFYLSQAVKVPHIFSSRQNGQYKFYTHKSQWTHYLRDCIQLVNTCIGITTCQGITQQAMVTDSVKLQVCSKFVTTMAQIMCLQLTLITAIVLHKWVYFRHWWCPWCKISMSTVDRDHCHNVK